MGKSSSNPSSVPVQVEQLKMANQVLDSIAHLKWRKLLAIFLTAGLLLCLPVFTLLFICMYFFRQIVNYFAKLIRPDLGALMSLGSAPFATDLIFSSVPKIPLILAISLKGRLEISEFRAAVSRLANDKDEKGVLKHPELRQSVTTWLGLIFWKWDTNFKVENHVNIFHEYAKKDHLTEDNLLEIGNNLISQKFDKEKSPWEFLVLYNYNCRATDSSVAASNEPRTLVILRTHHCLGDGFSLLKLFLVDLSGETLKVAQPVPYEKKAVTPDIYPCQKYVRTLCFPVRVAYELMTQVVNAWDFNNEWRIPEWKLSRRMNGGVSVPIPLEYVKNIKNTQGTTFTAVPLAAFTGGIRNFMLERGVPFPDKIHCLAALPFPGHPWKLRNHLTGSMIELPLGIPTARERLLTIEKTLFEIKSSTVPTTLFYLMKIAGLPFAFISYIFFRNILTTAVNSNFPGPDVETKFVGLPIQDAGFAIGFGSGNTVIALGSLSYNGNIRLMIGFDEAVLPANVSTKRLIAKIMEELKILEQSAPTNQIVCTNFSLINCSSWLCANYSGFFILLTNSLLTFGVKLSSSYWTQLKKHILFSLGVLSCNSFFSYFEQTAKDQVGNGNVSGHHTGTNRSKRKQI